MQQSNPTVSRDLIAEVQQPLEQRQRNSHKRKQEPRKQTHKSLSDYNESSASEGSIKRSASKEKTRSKKPAKRDSFSRKTSPRLETTRRPPPRSKRRKEASSSPPSPELQTPMRKESLGMTGVRQPSPDQRTESPTNVASSPSGNRSRPSKSGNTSPPRGNRSRSSASRNTSSPRAGNSSRSSASGNTSTTSNHFDSFSGQSPSQPSDEMANDTKELPGAKSAPPRHIAIGMPAVVEEGGNEAGIEMTPTNRDAEYKLDRMGSSSHIYPSVWLRLPNTSFGISLGLAGQAIMWRAANNAHFISDVIDTETIGTVFWLVSLLVGVMLFTAYVMKVIFYRPLVIDEYKDASRIHFFNMPHIIVIMLTISVPESGSPANMMAASHQGQRIIWTITFLMQILFTQHVYEGWLFSESHTISCAKPQFLLSTVGWILLAVLGVQADIEGAWGVPLPAWCLGFGLMLYLMVAISIFNGIHHTPNAKGSPALFLLIAPPSVAVVATDLLDGEPDKFSFMALLLLGWCLGLFLLLVRIGPKIWQKPPALGAYWAYVFPLTGLATALIRYAWAVNTTGSFVAATIFVVIAILALFIVCVRMFFHIYQVSTGASSWGDPLLSTERLVAVQAITYSELYHDIETA